MRTSKKIAVAVIVMSAVLAVAIGGCKKKKKKKRVPDPPAKIDKGPNSCDLRGSKNLCMEYMGANSTAEEIADNCAGWAEAAFIKGGCPVEGAVAGCTQVLGPTTIRMLFYEGIDLAEQEEGCKTGGHKWEEWAKK